MEQKKPLTKALHTVRVVRRIADHLLLAPGCYAEVCHESDASLLVRGEVLLQRVCELLGNEMPVGYDPLYGHCHAACEYALRDWESARAAFKSTENRLARGTK